MLWAKRLLRLHGGRLFLAVLLVATTAGAARPPRGYQPRGCGFDFNHNGVAGETADCNKVCSGGGAGHMVTNFDGAGGTLLQWFVDCTGGGDSGNDCQSSSSPCATLSHAMSQIGSPGANTAQAICFTGSCSGRLIPTQGGRSETWTRTKTGSESRDWVYPKYPLLVSGWDVNGNGNYPPQDTTDKRGANAVAAVWDGASTTGQDSWAILNDNILSSFEFAHFSAPNWGNATDDRTGFLRPTNGSGGTSKYWNLHDLDLSRTCYNVASSSSGGVPGHQNQGCHLLDGYASGTVVQWVNFSNINAQDVGGWVFRENVNETNASDSGPVRLQGFSYLGYAWDGTAPGQDSLNLTRIWGSWSQVEWIDSIWDSGCGASYGAGGHWKNCGTDATASVVGGVSISQNNQDIVIRNNTFSDWKSAISFGFDPGFCVKCRRIDNVVIDANLIQNTHSWGYSNSTFIDFAYSGTTEITSIGNIDITNNFFWTNLSSRVWGAVFDQGVRAGLGSTWRVAGNTVRGVTGSFDQGGSGAALIDAYQTNAYAPQQNWLVKDNLVKGLTGRNVLFSWAPSNLQFDGNVYDSAGAWNMAGTNYSTLAAWRAALGGCPGSNRDCGAKTCAPTFVGEAGADLRLQSTDTCARGAGVDISAITSTVVDYDGNPRPATAPDSGASQLFSTVAAPTLLQVVPVN